MATHNRRLALERLFIGVPLLILAGLLLVIALIPGTVIAIFDIIIGLVLNREPIGDPLNLDSIWQWNKHNGQRFLYGQHDEWQFFPGVTSTY